MKTKIEHPQPPHLDRRHGIQANKLLTAALIMCMVQGLASSASAATFTHWHKTENPPVTTGTLFSEADNWTNDNIPGQGGTDAFRIEQYPGDAAGSGPIIMDVDYSATPLVVAQFFGGETVYIQDYFKATVGGTIFDSGIMFNNGGNNPNGAYVRVDAGGTIDGDLVLISVHDRGAPTIEFAGGDWVAGNLRNPETDDQRKGHQNIKFSSDLGSITPGVITTWSDAATTNFIFEFVAGGVTPVILTDPDPLQFTGPSAGLNPFNLTVDLTAYTGVPSCIIPLFIFQNSSTETDRLFDEANITITGVPVGREATVVQTDSGVHLAMTPCVDLPPLGLEIDYFPADDMLSFTWDSQAGMVYNLRSEVDPSNGDPRSWPIFGGHENIEATPPENTLTIPLPADAERFFVIEEFPAPPASVLSDDFEGGQGAWTTGSDGAAGTTWEFGSPTVVGPAAANSGANCFGTNLSANYADDADVWLRSPAIDLAAAGGATLNFSHYVDIEEGFDSGQIRLLDADAALAELAILQMTIDGNNPTGWEPFSKALPAAALGQNVVIEFRFNSDDFSDRTQGGWYIDDFEVTVP